MTFRYPTYSENGFAVGNSPTVANLIKKAVNLLAELLGSDSDLVSIHKQLVILFENQATYVGFLKSFANTPEILSFASDPDVIALAQKCGVQIPSLATPPILHVVSNSLLINRDKVFTPMHQDVISTRGTIGQTVIWIPLHSVAKDNFGIRVLPGTHRLGALGTDFSEFGHTVKKQLIPNVPELEVELGLGDIVSFSQYLIHKTHTVGNFRMAVSFRFNDMADNGWKNRHYFAPFTRGYDSNKYEDGREIAPVNVESYFSS
jgi:hypothetical protein